MHDAIHPSEASGAGEAALKPPPQLVMWRKTLAGLPEVTEHPGVSCRSMRDGDASAWDTIVSEAFGWPEPSGHFEAHMRHDPSFAPERVYFVLRDGLPVATASAWCKPDKFGVDVGYLHFVAVRPGHTNRGLGTLASLVALHAMAADGRTSVVLLTDDHRQAAISIYLKLGFSPLVTHESHRDRWRDVFGKLPDPSLVQKFADDLDADV